MGKEVQVMAPPPGYQFIKIGKHDPVPGGSLPAKDVNGAPVKRCYYVPLPNQAPPAPPVQNNVPSYLPTAAPAPQVVAPTYNTGYPGAPQYDPQYSAPPVMAAGAAGAAVAASQVPRMGGSASGPWACVVHSNFTFPTKKKYMFKEAAYSISGGDAQVLDMENNREAFAIRGTFSRDVRGGHRLITSGNMEVAQVGRSQEVDVKKMIKKELGLAKSGRCIFDVNGKKLGSLAEKTFKFGADSTLVMTDGREINIDASFRGKEFKCTDKGVLLYTIIHKTSAKSILMGKDDYEIIVEPNVDSVLAVATCLILEDLFRPE